MTDLKAEPTHFLRMPGQQADVMPGSSLAVLAVFTEIIRQRFRTPGELAWMWRDNATPLSTEENTEDDPSLLVIEPAFAEDPGSRNASPAIYVDHGDIVPAKVAVNNFVGQHLPSGLRGYYALVDVPLEIEVVSKRRAESGQIADIVWFYLLAGREPIQQTFGLQNMSNPVLSRTIPFEQDRTKWSTRIMFQISFGARWSSLPIPQKLNEIVLRVRREGATSLDEVLLAQYIR